MPVFPVIKNKFMRTILSVLMAITVLSASAATDYGITVNGTAIKSDKLSFSAGGGTVSYSIGSNTLTISGVSFSRSGEALKVSYNTNRSGTLKIVFNGSCQLVSTGNDCLILEDDVDFTIGGATTLGTTSGGKCGVHIKEGTTSEFAGSGTLVVAATDGYAISGDADDEWAFFKIASCKLTGQRGNLVKLGKVKIQPVSTNVERSTSISLQPTKSSSYPHAQSVRAWEFGTDVHIESPKSSTTNSITLSINYSKEFIIGDERNDPQYTVIGNFQYGTAVFQGTPVAVLVKPTVSFKTSPPDYFSVPGLVTIGGSTRPVVVNSYALSNLDNVGIIYFNFGVVLIQNYAMTGCSKLSLVILPGSLKMLSNYAFSGVGGSSSDLRISWATLDPSKVSLSSTSFSNSASNTLFYFSTVDAMSKASNMSAVTGVGTLSGVQPNNCYDVKRDRNYYVVDKGFLTSEAGEMCLVGCELNSTYKSVNVESGNCSTTILDKTYYCTSVAPSAFKGYTNLSMAQFKDSHMKVVGAGAFEGCSGISSLSLCEGITTLGNSAFNGCSSITYLTIPSTLTTMGNQVFRGCTGLKRIYWNAKAAADFSDAPFSGLTGITEFIFGNNVTRVPANLCKNLYGLKEVRLPSTVTYIGNYAFRGCTGLANIYPQMTNPSSLTYGSDIFYNVSRQTCVLTVPAGTLAKYKATMPWKDFYTIKQEGGIFGDLNGDGQVNAGDVSDFYTALLAGSTDSQYDLNGDGSVNTGDVSILYKIILDN